MGCGIFATIPVTFQLPKNWIGAYVLRVDAPKNRPKCGLVKYDTFCARDHP